MLTVTATAAIPAPGLPTPDLLALAGPARGQVAHAEALRDALLAASPADAVRLAAAEAGYALPSRSVAELTLAEAVATLARAAGRDLDAGQRADLDARVAALPAGLEAPTAHILSAAAAAAQMRAEAVAGLAPEQQELLLARSAELLAPGGGSIVETRGDAPVDAPPTPVHADAAPADLEGLAAKVDVGLLAEAEALLAQAVTEAMPALDQAAQGLEPAVETHCPVAGSVFQFPPYLAIDGTGSCLFHTDWWVSIDLGGNDVYNNNAGGTTSAIFVAAAVDLGGTETYARTAASTTTTTTLATQGAALLGVGLLVDAAGSDSYQAAVTITPPPLTNPAPGATLAAQGGAALGAGLLVDLAGPNTFSATASTLGAGASVSAQGGAGLGGVGVLVSADAPALGAGTADSYAASSSSNALLIASSPTSQTWTVGGAATAAQGGGIGGAGAMVDAFGNDAYSATSSGGSAATAAQGGASIGAGLAVDGDGTDSWFAQSLVNAGLNSVWPVTCPAGFICSFFATVAVTMGSAATFAQGAAAVGAGLLADAGAGGAHTAKALVNPVGSCTVTFAGGGGSAGTLSCTANVVTGDGLGAAHGYGGAGAGALLGSLGNDAYSLTASTIATASATATGGSPSVASASATAGNADGRAQGSANLGVGVLVEPGGNDAYSVTEASSAVATTSPSGSMSTVPGSVVWSGRGATVSAGLSLLLDAGGAGDSYGPVYSGLLTGAPQTCWTNSPPGLPDLRIAMGMDVFSTGPGPLPATCTIPPPN
jgi:hypothetical protein